MKRQGGLTLIEVIVAVAIFAFVAAMAYGGLFSALGSADTAKTQGDRLGRVQKAFTIMESDFSQALDRPVRDAYGGVEAAFLTDIDGVSFTRGGRGNPLNRQRTSMARISYRMEDDKLIRRATYILDPMQEPEYQDSEILDGVSSMRLRLMPPGPDSEWVSDWPPLAPGGQPPALPRGVEVVLTLEDWGEIRRVFALAL